MQSFFAANSSVFRLLHSAVNSKVACKQYTRAAVNPHKGRKLPISKQVPVLIFLFSLLFIIWYYRYVLKYLVSKLSVNLLVFKKNGFGFAHVMGQIWAVQQIFIFRQIRVQHKG